MSAMDEEIDRIKIMVTEEVGKVFEHLPAMTERQRDLVILLGSRLYNRGCINGLKALESARELGARMNLHAELKTERTAAATEPKEKA